MKIDDSDKSTGWKFSEQEILGIPTRIEIGPKDIENNQAVIVRRDTREKIVVSLDEIETKLGEILETIQKDMYDRAKAFLDSHIDFAETMDEMNEKNSTPNVDSSKQNGVEAQNVKMRSRQQQVEQPPAVSAKRIR